MEHGPCSMTSITIFEMLGGYRPITSIIKLKMLGGDGQLNVGRSCDNLPHKNKLVMEVMGHHLMI